MKLAKRLLVKKIIIPFLLSNFLAIAGLGVVLIASIALFSIGGNDGNGQACVPSTTGDVQIDNKTTEENAAAIYKYLIEVEQATPQGASGVMGALDFESGGFNPAIVNSSSGAYGLAQWLGGRKTALEGFAKEKGKDMSNLGLQLAFLSKELKDPYYAKAKAALFLDDIHEAQKEWLMWYEGLSQNPEQWFLEKRNALADKWYSTFGLNDPISSSTVGNAIDGEIGNVPCSTTNSGYSGDDVLKMAESLIGYFHYSQSNRAQFGSVESPDKNGYADCSSFVWLVLAKGGYNVPENVGWFTGSMTDDARNAQQYLKEIPQSEGEAGDIIIVNFGLGVGNNGHTAILAEKWHGLDTKIIEQGGMQTDLVGYGQVNLSFASLLNGGDVCIARPIKK